MPTSFTILVMNSRNFRLVSLGFLRAVYIDQDFTNSLKSRKLIYRQNVADFRSALTIILGITLRDWPVLAQCSYSDFSASSDQRATGAMGQNGGRSISLPSVISVSINMLNRAEYDRDDLLLFLQ